MRAFLPADLPASAREHGAVRRRRGALQDAETLLRVLLLHVGGGVSLQGTAVRASEQGLVEKFSAVALFKRLRTSGPWLEALCAGLAAALPAPAGAALPAGWRLRALDGTCVSRPGSTGTDWRLHYSLRLPEMVCDFVAVSDAHTAEGLRLLPVEAGDIVLVDRAYSRHAGVAAVLAAGAAVVVRLLPASFPLRLAGGAPFDLVATLQKGLARAGAVLEVPVEFTHAGRTYALRLCAVRKSRAATEKARRHARREREKKGGTVRAATLVLAGFVCVLTSLPAQGFSGAQVLELYRCRWQVELAFKRLKSLLGLGQLPKESPQSARAWLQAKVLVALLTDRLILAGGLFSPWGYPLGA